MLSAFCVLITCDMLKNHNIILEEVHWHGRPGESEISCRKFLLNKIREDILFLVTTAWDSNHTSSRQKCNLCYFDWDYL